MSDWHWALTKFVKDKQGKHHEVAKSYSTSGGVLNPRYPDELETAAVDDSGQVGGVWGLVLIHCLNQEAAATDPRVQPYYSLFDEITPDTVESYRKQGAKAGMMLGQLLAVLVRQEASYKDAMAKH
jgi:hypothetical protein